ncbi:MAG: hypothetical protein M3M99_08215 [Actinomycetota bacterium]|nr:hypothetical protein [Actinomycetota bacterium]
MLIRINQQENLNTYTNPDETTGGLARRIRANDIFVINTRFELSSPTIAAQLATNIRAAFPCNRIIGLNGLSFNPAAPGYAFALFDHPAVWALMSDFEPMDWNAGIATDPARPGWATKYRTALARIKAWMGLLSGTLASNPVGASKRAGLVPIDYANWNYGEIAQAVDKKNLRLGGRHLGPQSVQTQDSCANGGAKGFAGRLKALNDQYRFKFIKKKVFRKGKKRKITVRRKLKKEARPLRTNLSTQISLSPTPNPNAGMAITKTSAATAAACTQAGLEQGQGAFFYFASDDAMRLLFAQPQIAALRPPPPA